MNSKRHVLRLLFALALPACSATQTGTAGTGGTGGTGGASEHELSLDGAARGTNPRFSPDGKKLAYLRQESGDYKVAVMAKDGTGSTNLASDANYLTGFAWKADGSEVVYSGDKVRAVAAAGGLAHDVITGFASVDPDLSPDGKSLVYGTNGGNMKLVDLSVATPSETDLGEPGISPRFSPDGLRIAYNSGQKLKLMVLATKTATEVLDMKDSFASIDWFKDGERLLAGTDRGIEIITLGATPERTVLLDTFAQRSVDLSPDEKSVVYSVNGQASLFILTGF